MAHLQATQIDNPFSRPATPGTGPHQLGFIGLGAMGYLMARNLAKGLPPQSPPLLVWNRTTEKAHQLSQEIGQDYVRVLGSIEEIAVSADIIFTNLANDEVVKHVYEKIAKSLSNHTTKPKILVETSTIYPSLAGELDSLISSIPHVHVICCPVFGTPSVADKAQLLIVMSGDYRSKKEVAHLLVPALGRKIIDLGGNLEKGPTFKLIGNSIILGSIELLAEAYTLGTKSGIDGSFVNELVQEIFPAPGMMRYSDRMLHDNFDGSTGFAIDGGIKDASHIRRLTAVHNSPMPAIDVAHQHLLTARALYEAQKREGKEVFDVLDWSSIIAGARVAAGLDGFDSSKTSGRPQKDV